MNIEPENRILRLLPANLNRTFDLLNDGWCYHHTRFNISQLRELYLRLDLPVSLTISTRGHKASSEEAFIITLTKLATGSTSTSLVEVFGATTDTLSQESSRKPSIYSTIRQMGCYTAIVCSVGYHCLDSLPRQLGANLIDLNTANCCLRMSGLLAFWPARLTRLARLGPV
jgi:hypothetical protein